MNTHHRLALRGEIKSKCVTSFKMTATAKINLKSCGNKLLQRTNPKKVQKKVGAVQNCKDSLDETFSTWEVNKVEGSVTTLLDIWSYGKLYKTSRNQSNHRGTPRASTVCMHNGIKRAHATRALTHSKIKSEVTLLTPTILNNNKPEKRERVCRKRRARNSSTLAFLVSRFQSLAPFLSFCLISVTLTQWMEKKKLMFHTENHPL